MKAVVHLAAFAVLLTACSETPIEERDEDAIADMEQQIEEDARSLEEAADQAVRELEEDIDAELADDGIGGPEPKQLPPASGN